ncbi:alpha/beta hydrolase [Cytobacillus depressus]|uniref:Alpha/beta hydrolase n=1 Tax=Cytobacillus depressus TaxID=1602942 RepID=A0A6L3VAP3_9BACI|nr:alpha/beta fold hydrolase [Cytobacillus depressus]KAB2337593.1 alpha/beta hydrolase [Cytobacillus depressus]
METPIVIRNRNNKTLVGMLHVPESNSSGPMVVFAHGFLGIKSAPHRIFIKMARQLANHGIASLRFDYFGSGDSEGEFVDATISSEVADLGDVLNFVTNLEHYCVTNVGLIGYSLGGCIASLALSNSPTPISSIVMWAPVSNPFWNFVHILGEERVNKGLNGQPIEFEGEQIGSQFIKELLSIDPIVSINHYNNPILIIHGEDDKDVLLINSLVYQQVFQHSSSQVIIHRSAGHLFGTRESENDLISQTLDWFKNIFHINESQTIALQ